MYRFLCLAFVLAIAAPAAGVELEAKFLGASVYTTVIDCPRYRKLVSGGPRISETVPTTLTAKGYLGWEQSCTFVNIDERYKDRIWTVSLACRTGSAEPTLRTEVWRRQSDGTLTVTTNMTPTTLVACEAADAAASVKKKSLR